MDSGHEHERSHVCDAGRQEAKTFNIPTSRIEKLKQAVLGMREE